MNSRVGNNQSKIWLIIVIILVFVCCCCLILAAAGVLYMRSEGATIEDFVSESVQVEPLIDVTEVVPQETEEEFFSQEQPVQEETLPPAEMGDYLMVISPSGIWKVIEETQEVTQLSNDVVDDPSPYRNELSPDKKFYAYITGDLNPTLVVLNMQTSSRVFETPLSGPNSQIKPDMTAADPGLSVLMAMQTFESMAWSPDSTHLAFVAAMDNANTDLYLFNASDLSITRLTDENSNTASINWSPDGRFIEFITVNNFGTGAGMDMDAIWVYDRNQNKAQLLEQSTSSGEDFLSWIDNESFFIYSWSMMCSNYNLRSINAVSGSQEVILESCFSGAAYDPVRKFGILSVSDMQVGACQCGEVDEYGTYSFGESLGMSDVGIKVKKFEQINAYGVELLESGNLFAVYTDEGLSHLFDNTGFPISIPNTVAGLKPYPSPNGEFAAWYPYYGEQTGLWITDRQTNLFELSTTFSGNAIWSDDGSRLYFFDFGRIFYADTPDFRPTFFAEIPDNQIYAIEN